MVPIVKRRSCVGRPDVIDRHRSCLWLRKEATHAARCSRVAAACYHHAQPSIGGCHVIIGAQHKQALKKRTPGLPLATSRERGAPVSRERCRRQVGSTCVSMGGHISRVIRRWIAAAASQAPLPRTR